VGESDGEYAMYCPDDMPAGGGGHEGDRASSGKGDGGGGARSSVEGVWLRGGMKAATVTSGSIRRQRLRRASGERRRQETVGNLGYREERDYRWKREELP
jgi:hypothetical protein